MENCTKDIPTPQVDMAPLLSPNSRTSDFLQIGKEIVRSFEDVGFIYLKNYGIQLEEIEDLVKATNKFFDLDYEYQGKFYRDVDTFHGFSNDFTELFNFYTPLNKRTSRYMFDITALDEPFPDKVPELKTASIPIAEKLVPLSNNIMKALELGLDFTTGFLVEKHKHLFDLGSFSDLRIMRYLYPTAAEQTLRCEAHEDFSTVTLQLYEDIEGLQIVDANGEWRTAKFYPGYALLFPSQLLRMMTGEKIKAAKHQVLNPSSQEDIEKPRHSVIFFLHGDLDADIRPYNHDDDCPVITAKEYILKDASKYFQKGPLQEMGKWEITPLA